MYRIRAYWHIFQFCLETLGPFSFKKTEIAAPISGMSQFYYIHKFTCEHKSKLRNDYQKWYSTWTLIDLISKFWKMHIYVCKHYEQKNKLYLTLTLTLTSQFCKIHMFVKIMIKAEKVIRLKLKFHNILNVPSSHERM